MSGGKVIIHLHDTQELFDIDDFSSITVANLLNLAQLRFYKDFIEVLADPSECLCDGPYAPRGIDDARFLAIVQMLQKHISPESIYQDSNIVHDPVHLWLCNYANNGFLLANTSTTVEQRHSNNSTFPDGNDTVDGMLPLPTYSKPGELSQASTDTRLIQNNLSPNGLDEFNQLLKAPEAFLKSITNTSESCDTANRLPNENVLKFINGFRSRQKKQYRTDFLPKTNKKNKERKPTNVDTTSQTANKKRKACTKNKQYAFYLQAIDSKNRSGDDKYTHLQVTKGDLVSLRKGETVSFYIAAIKEIGDRRYVDALKGFLTDKKKPTMPLENPCLVSFKWANRKQPLQNTYPLKLVLVQVSGDANRKSKTEFNDKFSFDQRTVDESSKYSDYDTVDDTDEPDEFKIVAVRAKHDAVLQADWSSLVESDKIQYTISKSNTKRSKEAPVASSCFPQDCRTTQENGEETDEDEEEEEANNCDEDYNGE